MTTNFGQGLIEVEVPQPTKIVMGPPRAPDMLVVPVAGPEGKAGPAGGATFDAIAASALSGHRVVRSTPSGRITYASNDLPSDMFQDLWLTVTAVSEAGSLVSVHTFGLVSEGGWNWAPGAIYLGANGVLTQTPPTLPAAKFVRIIGTSAGPSSIFLNPQPGILLS